MNDHENKLWVIQHNALVAHAVTESVLRLGATERRIMAMLFALAGKTPQSLAQGATWDPEVRVQVQDFCAAFGVEHNDAYTLLRKSLPELAGTTITVSSLGGRDEAFLTFPLVVRASYRRGQGWFGVKLNDELQPYLCDLQRNFTKYKLETLGRLGSAYAIRLYEWLKCHESQRACRATVAELRKVLSVEDGTYDAMRDFQKRVLQIAVNQVNAETDLQVVAHPDRGGRGGKILGWTFAIAARMRGKRIASAQIIKHPREVVPEKHLAEWWRWVRGLPRAGCAALPPAPSWADWDAAGITFSFSAVERQSAGLAEDLYAEWLAAVRAAPTERIPGL